MPLKWHKSQQKQKTDNFPRPGHVQVFSCGRLSEVLLQDLDTAPHGVAAQHGRHQRGVGLLLLPQDGHRVPKTRLHELPSSNLDFV